MHVYVCMRVCVHVLMAGLTTHVPDVRHPVLACVRACLRACACVRLRTSNHVTFAQERTGVYLQ